jgi:hypothetical protein
MFVGFLHWDIPKIVGVIFNGLKFNPWFMFAIQRKWQVNKQFDAVEILINEVVAGHAEQVPAVRPFDIKFAGEIIFTVNHSAPPNGRWATGSHQPDGIVATK